MKYGRPYFTLFLPYFTMFGVPRRVPRRRPILEENIFLAKNEVDVFHLLISVRGIHRLLYLTKK